MKRVVIILAVAAVLSGCVTLIPTERRVYTHLLDFRQYAGEGFIISPNPFNGTFVPIGVITIDIYPATRIAELEWGTKVVVPELISLSDALDIAVSEARKLGANALVDYSWFSTEQDAVGPNGKIIKERYYTFSGFAIKRK